jgi:hypothetical protein
MVAQNGHIESADDDGEGLNQGLEPRQERAIIALLNEPTIAKAADTAGVGERTLHRWLEQDQKFSKAYRRARREAFSHAIALTNRYAPHAVNTLVKVMSDSTAPHSARVSASVAMLRFSREGIELDDMVARIEALEEAAAKTEQPSRWNR